MIELDSGAEGYSRAEKPRLIQESFVESIRDSTRLLLHPTSPLWVELNGTGYTIFRLADGTRTVPEIIAAICQAYGIEPARATADIVSFLDRMEQAGFSHDRGQPDESRWQKLNSTPRNLFIHLTRKCNLLCPHCYVGSNDGVRWEPRPEEITRILGEAAQEGINSLAISGGEPLLYSALEEVLRSARSQFKIFFNTNGTLLTPATSKLLAQTCLFVQVSLDGSCADIHDLNRGMGNFDRTMKGIRLLQDAGLGENILLCVTLTHRNMHDVPAMIELAEQEHIPAIRFMQLMMQGRAVINAAELCPSDEEIIRTYEQILPLLLQKNRRVTVNGIMDGLLTKPLPGPAQDQYCPIGRTLIMDFDGEVSPCVLLKNRTWGIGNLYNESVHDILAKGKIQALGTRIRKRRDTIPLCRTCSWKNFCQAGCPATVLREQQTLDAVDRFCKYRRRLYPHLFNLLIEHKEKTKRVHPKIEPLDEPFAGVS